MEKIKVLKVTIFATDDFKTSPHGTPVIDRQAEVFLPLDAVSHVTRIDRNNVHSDYQVHIKKNYPMASPFPIKSINTIVLKKEQVEVLNNG